MREKINKKDVIDYLSSHPEDLLEIANSLVLESNPEAVEVETASIPDWEEFFMDDYKDIQGKCFINKGLGIVLGILDCPEDRNSYEFLFEQFEKWDSDGEWHCKDYIWLQNCGDLEYEKYKLTTQTEMNIASENMYHLGSDGNLYLWTGDCENEYYKFTPLDQRDFDIIREEAIKNDGV